MKAIFLAFLIIMPIIASAESHFEQYFGCYETKSVNQKSVESENPLQTEIVLSSSPYIDSDSRLQIPAIKFFIYLGKFSDGHHMQLSYLPIDRGVMTTDSKGDHYAFDGKIRFTTNPEKIFSLHIKIDFKKLGPDLLDLVVFNKFDEAGNGNTTHFLLLKTDCSDSLVTK